MSTLEHRCENCPETKDLVKLIKYVKEGDKFVPIDFFLCKKCWHIDLNNDSGNYFDNFMG